MAIARTQIRGFWWRPPRVYGRPVAELFEAAGYVDAPGPTEIDRAFVQVLTDPKFRFGTRFKGPLDQASKRGSSSCTNSDQQEAAPRWRRLTIPSAFSPSRATSCCREALAITRDVRTEELADCFRESSSCPPAPPGASGTSSRCHVAVVDGPCCPPWGWLPASCRLKEVGGAITWPVAAS